MSMPNYLTGHWQKWIVETFHFCDSKGQKYSNGGVEASRSRHFLAIAGKSQLQLPLSTLDIRRGAPIESALPETNPLNKRPQARTPGANAFLSRRLSSNGQNRFGDNEGLFY
jgi:hypothetical protein